MVQSSRDIWRDVHGVPAIQVLAGPLAGPHSWYLPGGQVSYLILSTTLDPNWIPPSASIYAPRKEVVAMFEDMVLFDRRGVSWKMASHYQERDATLPGWLALESSNGEVLTWSAVMDLHGFVDGDRQYLRAVRG